jgi:hypothetical protein
MLTLKDNRNGGNCKKHCWYGAYESLLSDIFHDLIMPSSSMPSVSEDRDNTCIPVTCSKCNETFETDSDYVVHYNERHSE